MGTKTGTHIKAEKREKTLVLYLDRPPANLLGVELLGELKERLAEAERDPAVAAVVLASKVEKYFSAGLDPEEIITSEGPREETFHALIGAHRALARFPKPTAAAIDGSALLGGFIISLGCDIRIASETTGKVSLSEVRLGLTPTRALIRLVSSLSTKPALIKDLVLGGRTLKAAEALEAGLVDKLAPAGETLAAAIREAEKLSKLPPKAFAAVKRTYREAICPEDVWTQALQDFREVLQYGEAAEGLAAVKEKRRPRWE
jgi:enoyl-CoA hydratase/carnithine racemase